MRIIRCFAAAFTASLTLLAPHAMAQTTKFGGRWSIEVVTGNEGCGGTCRYSVQIQNGTARYGGEGDFNVSGQVQPSGAVRGAISRGQDRADVVGRLKDETGTGTWPAATSDRNCSGR